MIKMRLFFLGRVILKDDFNLWEGTLSNKRHEQIYQSFQIYQTVCECKMYCASGISMLISIFVLLILLNLA